MDQTTALATRTRSPRRPMNNHRVRAVAPSTRCIVSVSLSVCVVAWLLSVCVRWYLPRLLQESSTIMVACACLMSASVVDNPEQRTSKHTPR